MPFYTAVKMEIAKQKAKIDRYLDIPWKKPLNNQQILNK